MMFNEKMKGHSLPRSNLADPLATCLKSHSHLAAHQRTNALEELQKWKLQFYMYGILKYKVLES